MTDTAPSQSGRDSTRQPDVRRVDSAELFRGDRELLINHDGITYRLRITKSGKLILHK